MMGWHAATGVWLAVALLFISATGLTWSSHAGARFQAVVDAVKGSTPAARGRTRPSATPRWSPCRPRSTPPTTPVSPGC